MDRFECGGERNVEMGQKNKKNLQVCIIHEKIKTSNTGTCVRHLYISTYMYICSNMYVY